MSKRIINETKKQVDHFIEHQGKFTAEKDRPKLKQLPSGIYKVSKTMSGQLIYEPMQALTDGLIDLPGHQSDSVIQEINNFWTPKTRAKFDKYGLVYKRGVLMYGPPGSGKSVTISKIMEQVVTDKGLVFFETAPGILFEAANEIKAVQGDIKILAVFEELDAWLEQTSEMLSMLDGEMQIDNIVFLATTNYIDRIPPRIKNRPSRFATVLEVAAPNAATREAFLRGKIGDEEGVNFTEWVNLTEGFMLDHLKDLIISVLCIGIPLEVAIEKLRTMNADDIRDENDNDVIKDTGNIDDIEYDDPNVQMALYRMGIKNKPRGRK